jgi:antitoxin HicB
MARRMKTSRSQCDRLLDRNNRSMTVNTPQRAVTVVGRRLRLELV